MTCELPVEVDLERSYAPVNPYERFSLLQHEWNVAVLWRQVDAWSVEKRREHLKLVAVPELSQFRGMVASGKSDELIDLSIPVLVVTCRFGQLMVDGYHRLEKAIKQGVSVLPAFVLEAEPGHFYRIRKTPHPFASTPNRGTCASCGATKRARVHQVPEGGW